MSKIQNSAPMPGKLFPNLRGAKGAELEIFLDFYPKLPKILHSTAMKVQKLFPQGPKLETLPRYLSGPTPKYSPLDPISNSTTLCSGRYLAY